jgi:hypothetical protein
MVCYGPLEWFHKSYDNADSRGLDSEDIKLKFAQTVSNYRCCASRSHILQRGRKLKVELELAASLDLEYSVDQPHTLLRGS